LNFAIVVLIIDGSYRAVKSDVEVLSKNINNLAKSTRENVLRPVELVILIVMFDR
jgi:hypothetical protein